jgi:hypothetical protein
MSKRKHSEEKSNIKVCELSPDSGSGELKRVIRDHTYVCKQCGNSASHQENLCQPEKLYSTW